MKSPDDVKICESNVKYCAVHFVHGVCYHNIGIWKGVHCHAEKVELFFKHRYWFIHRNFYWVRNL